MPRVSVIVPTYNRSAFLKKTLTSIVTQSFSDLEILVFDNASVDNTTEVVKEFTDPRIVYHKNIVNLGVVENYNAAFQKSKGELIHIFSDDDIMHASCIEKLVNIFDQNRDIKLVHCGVKTIDINDKVTCDFHWGLNIAGNNLFLRSTEFQHPSQVYSFLYSKWNFICMPSVMIRNSILSEIGVLNNNVKFFCDWDFWLRISLNNKLFYLNETLVYYRQHTTNIYSQNNCTNSFRELVNMKINTGTIKNIFQKLNAAIISMRQVDFYFGRINRAYVILCFLKLIFVNQLEIKQK
jgi:glycosyltransferase involved in cell wall biosynthesis